MTVCNVNFARVFSENPQSSSPMQTNPRLTRQLEITNLHVRLLHDPDKVARKTSDLNFLFYFRDIFDDYFRKVLFYLVLNLNSQSITLNFCHLDKYTKLYCAVLQVCLPDSLLSLLLNRLPNDLPGLHLRSQPHVSGGVRYHHCRHQVVCTDMDIDTKQLFALVNK